MTVVTLNHDARTVTVDGVEKDLPPRLWDMCVYMSARPNVVRTKQQIMDAIGISENSYEWAVPSVVKRLKHEHGIENVKARWGHGYVWRD